MKLLHNLESEPKESEDDSNKKHSPVRSTGTRIELAKKPYLSKGDGEVAAAA